MSILRVYRKAANEADAQKLLKATYRLKDPFGVPTMFLRPEDYSEFRGGLRVNLKQELLDQISASFGHMYEEGELTLQNDLIDGLTSNVLESLGPEYFGASYMRYSSTCYFSAHNYDPDDYDQPNFCVINAPRQSQNIQSFAKMATAPLHDVIASTPPTNNAQLQFYTLWHEIGHGTGADEPQTEIITAIMCKRSFEDTKFLAILSDLRAFNALNRSHDIERSEKYGWPMVDALDYVHFISPKDADALSENQIKSLRFMRFDHQIAALEQASDLIAAKAIEDQTTDFPNVIRNILQRDENENIDDAVKSILKRFALAAHRLSIGAQAYDDDTLEKQMWEDGYQFQSLPINVPEFLPDPSLVSPV